MAITEKVAMEKSGSKISVDNPLDKEVIVNIWIPRDDENFGHVSLKIIDGDETEYISFYPLNISNYSYFCGVDSKFLRSHDDDLTSIHRPPDRVEHLTDFDTRKMLNRAVELKTIAKRWALFICTDLNANCCTLTMDILIAGDTSSRLPFNGQLGGYKHLFMLCASRIFIAVSLLTTGLYPVLDDNEDEFHAWRPIIVSILATISSGATIAYLERKRFPRKPIEMDWGDYIVGIGASLGFGAVAFTGKALEKIGILSFNNELNKAIADAVFFIPLSMLGLILVGKITSLLINICNCSCCRSGTKYTQSPQNIAKWVEFANNASNPNAAIKDFICTTEIFSLFSLLYLGAAGCVLSRRAFFISSNRNFLGTGIDFSSGVTAFYLGLPVGILLNYGLTKFFMYLCHERLNDESAPKKDLGLYSYFGRFTLTTGTTLLGVMGGLHIVTGFSLPDFLTILANPIGGSIGFWLGSYFFNKIESCITNEEQKGTVEENKNLVKNLFSPGNKKNHKEKINPAKPDIEKTVTADSTRPVLTYDYNRKTTGGQQQNLRSIPQHESRRCCVIL